MRDRRVIKNELQEKISKMEVLIADQEKRLREGPRELTTNGKYALHAKWGRETKADTAFRKGLFWKHSREFLIDCKAALLFYQKELRAWERGFVFFEAVLIIGLATAIGLAGQYVYDSMREEEIKKESPIIQEYIDHHMPRYRARRI